MSIIFYNLPTPDKVGILSTYSINQDFNITEDFLPYINHAVLIKGNKDDMLPTDQYQVYNFDNYLVITSSTHGILYRGKTNLVNTVVDYSTLKVSVPLATNVEAKYYDSSNRVCWNSNTGRPIDFYKKYTTDWAFYLYSGSSTVGTYEEALQIQADQTVIYTNIYGLHLTCTENISDCQFIGIDNVDTTVANCSEVYLQTGRDSDGLGNEYKLIKQGELHTKTLAKYTYTTKRRVIITADFFATITYLAPWYHVNWGYTQTTVLDSFQKASGYTNKDVPEIKAKLICSILNPSDSKNIQKND